MGAGRTLEANYVGRMDRHLLQSLDLAEPVDYTDPSGDGDYFTARTTLAKIADANGQNSGATVQPSPYFEHVFPQMANHDYPGGSATQVYYSD